MIILDNLIFELQKIGGVSRYWANLIDEFSKKKLDINYLEGDNSITNIYRKKLFLKKVIKEKYKPQILKRIMNLNEKCEIFHSSYYRISNKTSKNIVTIHDMMNEQRLATKKDYVLSYLKKRACKKAFKIISISNYTKKEILKYYQFLDPSKISVIHHGVDEVFYPEIIDNEFYINDLLIKPKNFYLYVGSRGYFKNFPYLINFINKSKNFGINHPLVLVGNKLIKSEIDLLHRYNISKKDIFVLENITNEQLRKLYSNCFALLIPSLYEGFGFTAAEAAKCKAIVISSKNSALPEVVGNSIFSLNLEINDDEYRVLENLNDSNLIQNEKIRIFNHCSQFNWENTAKKIYKTYFDV